MERVADEVLEMQVVGYRGMSPARKLAIAWGLRAFAMETKLGALRERHPAASDSALREMLRELVGADRP